MYNTIYSVPIKKARDLSTTINDGNTKQEETSMSQKGAFIDTKSACIMILGFLPSGTGMNKFLLFISYLIDYCLQQKNTTSKLPYLCG